MSAVDFLDTNVLIYVVDRRNSIKQGIAQRLVFESLISGQGIISFQVVQETLQTLTRKARQVAPTSEAAEFFHAVLTPLWRVQPTGPLYDRALQVQEQQGFSFYDSLIVAAALEANCKRLLTEDLQHGQNIGSLRIENPFLAQE